MAALTPLAGLAGNVPLGGGLGGAFTVNLASLPEARWDTVTHQRYDFSCGSAALATLMTYHYNIPTSEDQVFKEMFAAGDQAKIRTEGFSMLDMKRYLDKRGFQSDGFRMSLDRLASIGVPAIALVDTRGYKHFVVVRGIQGDRVLLADPAIGSIVITRETFTAIWNGIVLAARQRLDDGREHFNSPRDWKLWPSAPGADSQHRASLSTFTLTLPGRHELGR